MAASKVYFTTFHTTLEENIQQKLSSCLLLTAGMDQIDFKNRYVAIKMHFGEPGNLATCARTMQRPSRILCASSAASRS